MKSRSGCGLLIALGLWLGLTASSSGSEKWQSLFNGSDLSGWIVKCKPQDASKRFWRVDSGTILADSLGQSGHDYVWLLSEKEYSDFVLRLKFQAYRTSPGNSGVQVRSRYRDDEGWLDGPQVDIHPPGPWRTGMMWDETRGNQRWIFPNLPSGEWVDESMSRPKRVFHFDDQGDGWNRLEISAQGTQIRALLNGVQITDLEGKGVLDDTVHKDRNVGLVGHLALQIHKGDQLKIRFKDIEIRE